MNLADGDKASFEPRGHAHDAQMLINPTMQPITSMASPTKIIGLYFDRSSCFCISV